MSGMVFEMVVNEKKQGGSFLLVAGFAESLLNFRGALIKSLLVRGYSVHVAAPDLAVGQSIRLRLEDMGVVVHDVRLQRAGLNPFVDYLTFFDLLNVIRHVRPVAVLSYTAKPVIYGSLASFFLGVPKRFALITGLGYLFQDEPVGFRLRVVRLLGRLLYRFALKNVQKVFFQNPDDLALFGSLGILSRAVETCVVNGSGVDTAYFSVAPLPSKFKFLMVARLLAEKGVREYVEAARLVKMIYPDIVFGLVGWIDDNPGAIKVSELDAWVASGTIEYLGKLDDVRPAISECSVYVLPSYREGTPRTVLEAMAMGRPVITTDVPGCRETVVEGENGFLVPAKTVEKLSEAMLRFVRDTDLVFSMGVKARHVAETKYEVGAVNALMLREMGFDKADF